MALAIEVHDLVKTYPGGVRAVDGVSFRVPVGTVFGLLGPNGAGKSTIVKVLTTLTAADSGTAQVVGLDVAAEPERVRRAIGCVFQKAAVDPEATGRENLLLQGRLYGVRGVRLRHRTDELLERFGLAEVAGRIARTYSGGMQRKLDVAMGLLHQPQVLFLDEPTTGLDPQARAEVWAELERLSVDEGLTILLTTHYLEEADALAAQLAIVDAGRVVVQGSPDELKAQLRGDAVVVDVTDAGAQRGGPADPVTDERVAAALRSLGDRLHELTVDGATLRARVDDGGRAVPSVLAALESAGLVAASVRVSRPSLDDVYLRYAGRDFASADAGGDR